MSLLTAATVLTGCSSTVTDIKITMATGSEGGVYYSLGNGLADIWSGRLGIVRPQVVQTAGSKDNVTRLINNQAQVGFSQADALEGMPGSDRLRALARMHDDYLQVIVRADLPVAKLRDLSGLRVSIGAKESGVEIIATKLLQSENVRPQAVNLGLDDSAGAMQEGRLDAFFWSGGLPTRRITDLTKGLGVRMLDLKDELLKFRQQYPVYGSATLLGLHLQPAIRPGHHARRAQLPARQRVHVRRRGRSSGAATVRGPARPGEGALGGAHDRAAVRDRDITGTAASRRDALLPRGQSLIPGV